MTNLVIVIAGMTAVTYLPRLLPLVMHRGTRLAPWQRRALRLVPVTAIGALVIPGGMDAVPGEPGVSAIGLLAAVGLALLVRTPILVVIGSVAATTLAIALGG